MNEAVRSQQLFIAPFFQKPDGKSEAKECLLTHKAGHTVPVIKNARVLQEREIERVGESKTRKVNIRIMAATNRDQIEISDLPLEIRQPADVCRPGAIAGVDARKVRIGRDLSKEELMKLLETSYWNKAEVARRLGVSRTAVWKYMKKWNIPLKKPS